MADFEGPGAITQAAPSIAASGDVVNPGGTQPAGFISGVGNVIYEGGSVVAQAAPSVAASGYCLNTAGASAVEQPVSVISVTGNTGVFAQVIITKSAGIMSGAGVVVPASSVSPEQSAARASVATRRDMQLPRVPTNTDPITQQWFNAIGRIIDKYIFGGDSSRLVSISDLVAGGIADRNGTGVTVPQGNLTTPPKVTRLTADGALASIIIGWVNPVFPNYSHTELWRASIDDIGQAVMIQQTPVESYIDMVGSGSTKYYWARAVSTAGVKGDWSAAAGVQGRTGFDPTYVRDIMTAAVWRAVTPYAAYQYVRPTEPNGYQYACIDGGRTGGDEPTWPTTVGNTVSDGDIVWQCVAADARVPFVVGTDPDGNPAVFIDTAYIEEATITSAKIFDLNVDKLVAGALKANVQLTSKLWYGFEEHENSGNEPGLWLGVAGDGLPRMRLSTGGPDLTRKDFIFDGGNIELNNVKIRSGDDCSFDDMTADSALVTRAQIGTLIAPNVVVVSDYVAEAGIGVDNPLIAMYYCFPGGCWRTERSTSTRLLVGNGHYRHYGYHQTGTYTSIVPYDNPDAGTLYRARQKRIGLTIKVSANGIGRYSVRNYRHHLDLYIFDEYQSLGFGLSYSDPARTTGVPSTYLGKITIPFETGGYAAEKSLPVMQNTGSGNVHVCDARVIASQIESTVRDGNTGNTYTAVTGSYVTFYIDDDKEAFGYSMGRRLKCAVVYKVDPWVGTKDDSDQFSYIVIDMQVVSDLSKGVARNDAIL